MTRKSAYASFHAVWLYFSKRSYRRQETFSQQDRLSLSTHVWHAGVVISARQLIPFEIPSIKGRVITIVNIINKI